jgi:endoglucanase
MLSAFLMALHIIMHAVVAKSTPTTPLARFAAFKRAKSLHNGINVSCLEQTWNKEVLTQNGLKASDFELLKRPEFKSVRLLVAFEHFEDEKIPVEQIFPRIDNIVKQCRLYGFKLVICYHSGNFNGNNHQAETARIAGLWLKLTKRYMRISRGMLFLELLNEALYMDPKIWKDALHNEVWK